MKSLHCCDELRIASISDIHLGHRRNPTKEIIKNLYEAFPDNEETAALDIIFIAGDVFDSLLSLPDDDVWEIKFWAASFLRLAKKYNIMVRVLEGTPRHDWKQSELIPNTNSLAEIGADLKYVKTISIEYIEQFGITVLYIPDEANTSTEKTYSQVQDLLEAKGLKQVDFAIMHGAFEHQLPMNAKGHVHNANDYLSIVKELIFIGHIHTHTIFDRIVAHGSFDRLSHGEEEPKGHIRATIRKNGHRTITFVENKGAKIFRTVNCHGMNIDETLEEIDRKVFGLPPGSYVRIKGDNTNPIFEDMNEMIRRYPLLIWNKQSVAEEKEENGEIEEDVKSFSAISITKDNLPGLLLERISRLVVSSAVISSVNNILSEVL